MRVALTRSMSLLFTAARKLSLLVSLTAILGSVACAGEEEQPSYTATDVEASELAATGQPLRCEAGEVRSCTIWLGQHGDLANCVHGLDICSTEGSWTGCVDEVVLSEHPDLYAQLATD